MENYLDLKNARLSLGLTLEETAKGLCSPSLLSLIERGLRAPKAQLVEKLRARLHDGFHFESSPSIPSGEYLVALAEIKLGSFSEALKSSAKIKDAQESSLIRALAFENQSEHALAMELLKPVLIRPVLSTPQFCLATQAMVRLCRDSGDFYNAIYWAEQSIQLMKQNELEQSYVFELCATLSSVYLEVGDFNKAFELVNYASRIDQNDWDRVVSLWAGGLVRFTEGKVEKAASMLREAFVLSEEHDRVLSRTRILQTCIWLEARAGMEKKPDTSNQLIELINYYRSNGLEEDLANTLNTMALVEANDGNKNLAVDYVNQSMKLIDKLPDLTLAKLLIWNSEVLLIVGDRLRIFELLERALRLLSDSPSNRSTATAWADLATLYKGIGESSLALECFQASAEAAGLVKKQEIKTYRSVESATHVASPLVGGDLHSEK